MNKIILAIVGLPGAGKNEVTEYLMKKMNWPKVYFGDVTFNELKKVGLEINEKNESKTKEENKERLGMCLYSILSIPKIKELYEESSFSFICFIYFQSNFFHLIKSNITKINFGPIHF